MTKTEECCPVFDPNPYQNKTIEWKDKLFVKDSMRTFLHMPLFGVFGKTVTRMMNKVDAAEANVEDRDVIMLCGDPSPWKSELFINVSREVPEIENVRITGTYLTKVYDGPYKEIRNWISDMRQHVKNEGKEIKDLLFYYTTCPKCAEKHGHNYIVGFAKVD